MSFAPPRAIFRQSFTRSSSNAGGAGDGTTTTCSYALNSLCLEEMLQAVIPAGAIFHLKSRRRREVAFDNRLRSLTEMTAARLHELVASGATPPPVLKPRCRGCSVRDLCMPELLSRPRSFTSYQNTLYHPVSDPCDSPIAP